MNGNNKRKQSGRVVGDVQRLRIELHSEREEVKSEISMGQKAINAMERERDNGSIAMHQGKWTSVNMGQKRMERSQGTIEDMLGLVECPVTIRSPNELEVDQGEGGSPSGRMSPEEQATCTFDKGERIPSRRKKHASIWWENLKTPRDREGKQRIVTWEKMKRELKKTFLPPRYTRDSFYWLHDFKQKELIIQGYTTEFEQLMMNCDVMEPEEQTFARYLDGF
ncbi:Retrotransposon gag domain [Dillenia turbinata]|uniref:Retrotransposon gag domain n=1 Tax=Dillenia turbinata TaxID=194707 RepID=A0AAN8W0V1_9MAGN